MSDQELIEAHTQAVADREDASTSGVKASLTTRIKTIERILREDRKVTEGWTAWAPAGRIAVLSDEDLVRPIHKVRQLLARDTTTARVRKVGTRELSTLEALAQNRELSVSDAVKSEPSTNGGELLDQTTDELAERMADTDADAAAVAEMSVATPKTSRRSRK